MREALKAHVKTHLRFFARNRIAHATGAIFLVFASLTILGSAIFTTTGGHIALIQQVGGTLYGMIRYLAPAMALLLVFSHVRDRSLRVVLTKPQPSELWLFSGVLAVAVIGLLLHVGVFLLQASLSLAWGLPSVSGSLVYIGLDSFSRSLISVGYLTLLSALFHPVVALLLLSLFNEETLQGIRELLALHVASKPGGVTSWVGERLCAGLYYLTPILNPFGEKTSDAVNAFRLTGKAWLYLAARTGYSVLALAAFVALAALAFRRKSWN